MSSEIRFHICVLALMSAGLGPPAFADNHPFTAEDLVSMARLSDPRVSPDGSRVAYVLRTTDLEANKGRTDLWLVALDGFVPPEGGKRNMPPEGGKRNMRSASGSPGVAAAN